MKRKGFSLIELLVVTTVIITLMAIGTVYYRGAQAKSRDNKRKVDLEQVRAGLEMYRSEEDTYPVGSSWDNMTSTLVTDDYLPSAPTDPKGYSYYYTSDGSAYTVCAYLESGGPNDCGDNCSAPEGASCNYQLGNP